jgi:hypothetical protein
MEQERQLRLQYKRVGKRRMETHDLEISPYFVLNITGPIWEYIGEDGV